MPQKVENVMRAGADLGGGKCGSENAGRVFAINRHDDDARRFAAAGYFTTKIYGAVQVLYKRRLSSTARRARR